ncbi:unnamed protein product [Amoebophrya sp. A25]|nr:unnamed protein product [Amoebophrya sp. A25]|eukprot:GSA25T00022175001.1
MKVRYAPVLLVAANSCLGVSAAQSGGGSGDQGGSPGTSTELRRRTKFGFKPPARLGTTTLGGDDSAHLPGTVAPESGAGILDPHHGNDVTMLPGAVTGNLPPETPAGAQKYCPFTPAGDLSNPFINENFQESLSRRIHTQVLASTNGVMQKIQKSMDKMEQKLKNAEWYIARMTVADIKGALDGGIHPVGLAKEEGKIWKDMSAAVAMTMDIWSPQQEIRKNRMKMDLLSGVSHVLDREGATRTAGAVTDDTLFNIAAGTGCDGAIVGDKNDLPFGGASSGPRFFLQQKSSSVSDTASFTRRDYHPVNPQVNLKTDIFPTGTTIYPWPSAGAEFEDLKVKKQALAENLAYLIEVRNDAAEEAGEPHKTRRPAKRSESEDHWPSMLDYERNPKVAQAVRNHLRFPPFLGFIKRPWLGSDHMPLKASFSIKVPGGQMIGAMVFQWNVLGWGVADMPGCARLPSPKEGGKTISPQPLFQQGILRQALNEMEAFLQENPSRVAVLAFQEDLFTGRRVQADGQDPDHKSDVFGSHADVSLLEGYWTRLLKGYNYNSEEDLLKPEMDMVTEVVPKWIHGGLPSGKLRENLIDADGTPNRSVFQEYPNKKLMASELQQGYDLMMGNTVYVKLGQELKDLGCKVHFDGWNGYLEHYGAEYNERTSIPRRSLASAVVICPKNGGEWVPIFTAGSGHNSGGKYDDGRLQQVMLDGGLAGRDIVTERFYDNAGMKDEIRGTDAAQAMEVDASSSSGDEMVTKTQSASPLASGELMHYKGAGVVARAQVSKFLDLMIHHFQSLSRDLNQGTGGRINENLTCPLGLFIDFNAKPHMHLLQELLRTKIFPVEYATQHQIAEKNPKDYGIGDKFDSPVRSNFKKERDEHELYKAFGQAAQGQ